MYVIMFIIAVLFLMANSGGSSSKRSRKRKAPAKRVTAPRKVKVTQVGYVKPYKEKPKHNPNDISFK